MLLIKQLTTPTYIKALIFQRLLHVTFFLRVLLHTSRLHQDFPRFDCKSIHLLLSYCYHLAYIIYFLKQYATKCFHFISLSHLYSIVYRQAPDFSSFFPVFFMPHFSYLVTLSDVSVSRTQGMPSSLASANGCSNTFFMKPFP